MARLPLEGVRVTDFSWIGAGSYTTKLLADFGADVIKIESSTRLDSLRSTAPFKDRVPGVNRSGYFADRNTSKRSVTVNMKHPRGQELARALIARSDVVANNFTPGTMEKFGLGYEDVRRFKPDIIYLAMSMQGARGPDSEFVGFGLTIGALTGLQYLSGSPERIPAGTGTNYPDHVPNPCHAGFAVLAALHHRRRTGRGQYIDFAQTEPTIALLGPAIVDYTANGRIEERSGNDHPRAAPHGVYPCLGEDRWIAICVMHDGQWRRLAEALGRPEWSAAADWSTGEGRRADRRRLDRLLAAETAKRDPYELMLLLQRHGVPAGVVQNAADLVARDPQLTHRGHWLRLEHPEMGESIYNAPPFRFSRTQVALSRPAPLLGQHTAEVLGGLLGMPCEEVAALAAEGVLV
ncbi:MAG: CoA transferase [Betaproteobacteria bacterium]|nr:CoA transferase [Betaproteobacteria bacterium]